MRPDFRIYTASIIPYGDEPSAIVRMTGSSTERDMQRNYMASEALLEMQDDSLVGMNIFLNHKYELPHDLYGRLSSVPEVVSADGFLDVSLLVETDTKNPPAVQTLQQIRDGHKHGCSIGCMVNRWDFAGESDNFLEDSIIIQSITPVEWSVVGIPANRRCWVENAIQGKFLRTLEEGDYDQAVKLAPTVKSLFSHDYEKAVLTLSGSERTLFEKVTPKRTPDQQIFWQPQRKTFIVRGIGGTERDLSRSEVTSLLQASWGKDAPDAAISLADDGGKAAQQARSKRYGIGIKDGGSVTKPGKWSSVPDSQWGDPVNYGYPMPDLSHANNAASRWGDASNRSKYNSKEQGIIGARIKRRQAALGGGKKDKQLAYSEFELVDDTDQLIPETTLDANSLHPPMEGIHRHSHMHGPAGSAEHNHPHVHHNDNDHTQHDHTGNMDGDGGYPDGDQDQDDWNEPGDRSGSATVTPPNDAQSNPGRANNSGNDDSSGRANKGVVDLDFLQMYNQLGKRLGFGSVSAEGMRDDGINLEGDNQEAFRNYLLSLTSQGLQCIYAAEQIAMKLGVEMPYLTFTVDYEASRAPALTPQHAVHAQSIHDHANAMLGGKGCGRSAMGEEPEMIVVPAQSSALQQQITAAEQKVLTLQQQIEQITGKGLGRPTSFTSRAVPVGIAIEAQTPEQLREKTLIAKRADGVKCRQWPTGHGIHQRPELSPDQMSIMSLRDIEDYREGREAFVPMIFDGD